MVKAQATVTLEHEGITVSIDHDNTDQGGGGLESAGNVAFDFSKLFKIASCVASCMLGSTAAASGAGTVADVKPGVGANAKPAK